MSRVNVWNHEMSRLGKELRSCRLVALVSVACLASMNGPASQSPPRWKTGQEFERALNAVVRDVVWSAGTPVRQAVTTLAQIAGDRDHARPTHRSRQCH